MRHTQTSFWQRGVWILNKYVRCKVKLRFNTFNMHSPTYKAHVYMFSSQRLPRPLREISYSKLLNSFDQIFHIYYISITKEVIMGAIRGQRVAYMFEAPDPKHKYYIWGHIKCVISCSVMSNNAIFQDKNMFVSQLWIIEFMLDVLWRNYVNFYSVVS